MNTDPEKEYLHRKAQLLLRQHLELTKEINWMMQRRIELETKLSEIDVALGNHPRLRASISRLDSLGGKAD